MKKLSVLLVAVAAVFAGSFQKASAQDGDCGVYASYYQEYYKQKNYQAALPNWRKAYALCAKNYKQNIYIHGAKLMNDEIKKNIQAKNFALAKAQYDTLITLLDERLQYYPTAKKGGVVVENKVEVLNNKGTYVFNYIALNDNNQKYLYDMLMPIVNELGPETSSKVLVNAFSAAVALYRENQLSADEVIAVYEQIAEDIEKSEAKNASEEEEKGKTKATVESLFADSKVASCDNLITIFGPRYEANPGDLALVSNIVRLMSSADDCSNNDLYLNAVTSMHKLDPSFRSAYGLYKLNSSRGNVADAAEYLQQAIDAEESDAALDAQYNYEMAAFCYKNGLRSKAFEAARKAVELDNGFAGKAYLIMGNLWASATCGDTVDNWARYWVAADYYQKARNTDPALSDEAASSISSVARYYPEASEAFMYDLTKGQSYTVSCGGISATTTVRVQ